MWYDTFIFLKGGVDPNVITSIGNFKKLIIIIKKNKNGSQRGVQ